MGHWNEQTTIRCSLWCHPDRCRDVSSRLNITAGSSRHSKMNCWMREGTVPLRTVEVLNKSRKGIKFARRRIPPDEDFPWIRFKMECEHVLMIIHIDLNLLHSFAMAHRIAIPDFHFAAIL